MSIRLTHNPDDYLDEHNRQYKIIAVLSRGGMGTVYRAVDCFTGAVKAVKECDVLDDPRKRQLSRAEAVRIFLDEARCIEDLRHDGIPSGNLQVVQQRDLRVCLRCGNRVAADTCAICCQEPDSLYYTPVEIDNRYYLVMEFIDGNDLSVWALGRPRPLIREDMTRIFGWLGEVATVLDYVHGRHLAHCDVKPANLRYREQDQRLFLLDFGLQRLESDSQKTQVLRGSRQALGTPGYAAPEQEAGLPGYPSDIYSLGMTAMALLTGLDPANPEDRRLLLQNRPAFFLPGLAPDIDQLLYHSLSLEPALRPSARAWAETLRDTAPFGPVAGAKAVVPPKIPKAPRKPFKWPNFAKLRKPALAALTLLALGALGWLVLRTDPDSLVQGTAQRNAEIYRSPGGREILQHLKGGEALRLRKTSDTEGEYWFEVLAVSDQRAKGYIRRSNVQVAKPRPGSGQP